MLSLNQASANSSLLAPSLLELNMDHCRSVIPPKAFHRGDRNIFDMNNVNDFIFPVGAIQLQNAWDLILKEASLNASFMAAVRSRNTSFDLGIKQADKTGRTTIEVNFARKIDDVIESKAEINHEHFPQNPFESLLEPPVVKPAEDDVEAVEDKEEPEIDTATHVPEMKDDIDDVKDSMVLSIIETMVDIQQKYKHLKSNWDHVGNVLSTSFSYLPIPGVVTRMLGFSTEPEPLDKKTPGATPKSFLPHGECKHCTSRRERHQKGRHRFGQYVMLTSSPKDSSPKIISVQASLKINGKMGNLDENLNLKDEQIFLDVTSDCSLRGTNARQNEDSVLKASRLSVDRDNREKIKMADAQEKRHLSNMSQDCARINRLLFSVVKDNMRRKRRQSNSNADGCKIEKS